MHKQFYWPLVVGSVVVLSGCASLELLSFGASSISYAVTGKSISDHAISKVMGEDCALHRAVIGEETCSEYESTGVLRAPRQNGRQLIGADNTESHWQQMPRAAKPQMARQAKQNRKPFNVTVSPDETVLNLMANTDKNPTQNNIQKASYTPNKPVAIGFAQRYESEFFSPQNTTAPMLFAVLGSFNELQYARKNQQQHHAFNAQIITNPAFSHKKNATKYRVVTGPMTEQAFNQVLGPEGEKQGYHAWRLRLCGDTLLPPPCTVSMLAQHSK
jgi:hypothetical protein